MFKILVVCAFITFSAAAPTAEDSQAKILNYENVNDGLGNYRFSFEASNGMLHKETGQLVHVGEPNEHIEVQGSYRYTDPEGKLIEVFYLADENGYRINTPQSPPLIFEDRLAPNLVASLIG